MPKHQFGTIVAVLLVSGVMLGCGDEPTIPSSTPIPPDAITLAGTAAVGAPIANAPLTVKDKNGTSRTATTDGSGKFVVNVTGLTAPFLVKVDRPSGAALYSVGTQPGIVNVTPFTDLTIGLWYDVQGKSLSTAFGNPLGNPLPAANQVTVIANLVTSLLQRWLTDNGVTVAGFDLISTPFEANNTGFDKVLASSTVDRETGTVTIKDSPANPTVTQVSKITVNTATSSATVATTTTSGANTSSDIATAVIPAGPAHQAALAGASAALAQFASTVNAKGSVLSDSDLIGFYDPDYLEDGFNAVVEAGRFAHFLRGTTISSYTVTRIISYDDANKIISVLGAVAIAQGGQIQTQPISLSFKQKSGADLWQLYGNRRPAETSLQVETRTDVFSGRVDGPKKIINVGVEAPKGAIQAVTITGGGIFSNRTAEKSSSVSIDVVKPTPTSSFTVETETFFAIVDLAEFPVPGTPIVVTVTPVTGTPTSYTLLTGGTTTESFSITSPTGHSLSDAKLGQSIPVTWTRAKTFSVSSVELDGRVQTAHPPAPGFSCDADMGEVAATGLSGTIRLPATCNGQPVVEGTISVVVEGPNGERTKVIYFFGS